LAVGKVLNLHGSALTRIAFEIDKRGGGTIHGSFSNPNEAVSPTSGTHKAEFVNRNRRTQERSTRRGKR